MSFLHIGADPLLRSQLFVDVASQSAEEVFVKGGPSEDYVVPTAESALDLIDHSANVPGQPLVMRKFADVHGPNALPQDWAAAQLIALRTDVAWAIETPIMVHPTILKTTGERVWRAVFQHRGTFLSELNMEQKLAALDLVETVCVQLEADIPGLRLEWPSSVYASKSSLPIRFYEGTEGSVSVKIAGWNHASIGGGGGALVDDLAPALGICCGFEPGSFTSFDGLRMALLKDAFGMVQDAGGYSMAAARKNACKYGYKGKLERAHGAKKKLRYTSPDGKVVEFGHKDYDDYTSHKDTKRRASYCKRSAGIKSSSKLSANKLARDILWDCGSS